MKSIALLSAALFLASNAYCVEFTVDQFAIDAVDTAPGDGSCFAGLVAPESGGQCTLRAAIMETNAILGADTILIPLRDPSGIPQLENLGLPISERIILDLAGEDTNAAVGDLDIQDDVTISVSPKTLLSLPSTLFEQVLPIIDASGLEDRIFEVRPNVDNVNFNGLVLTGGSANGLGGAVFAWEGGVGEVLLTAVDVVANTGSQVGAIYTRSPMRIVNSRFHENIGTTNGSIVEAERTSLEIVQSSFYNNTVPGAGGVVNARSSSATPTRLKILSSSILANDANGVLVSGNSLGELQNLTVSENQIALFLQANATSPPSLVMSHTVLANSSSSFGRNCVIPDEVTSDFLSIDDYNLIDAEIFCDEIATGLTNLRGIPAGLSPAAPDTRTWHYVATPEEESVLIDNGDTTAVNFDMEGCVFLDQRMNLRPQYGEVGADESQPARCDIGAIEFLPEGMFANGFEPTAE